MKVLLMYVNRFSYSIGEKNLEEAESQVDGKEFSDALLAFIQVEESDEIPDILSREKKLVNHLKWALRKNNCHRIILHSFAHLSSSKA